jgi:hypothetical protein
VSDLNHRCSDDKGHADGLYGKLQQGVVSGFHGWIYENLEFIEGFAEIPDGFVRVWVHDA